MSSGIAIAWLPNSLLLAFFLIKDKKEWPFYIPFFVIAEIIADYPTFTIIQSLQFAFINIFETTVAALIIKKFSGNQKINFSSIKYVIVFFLVGLNIMPAISGIFGALVYYTQISVDTSLVEFWRIWYFGDAVGILLLTPLAVLLIENYKSLKNYDFNVQNIITVIFTLFIAVDVFSFNHINTTLLTTPQIFILIFLWIVYKKGILPALILSFFISLIAIHYTLNGMGPFSIYNNDVTTIYLQEFIASLISTIIFIGALLKEKSNANNKLEELNKILEIKIEEKTKSLVEANENLTKLVSKDFLTNIYNRRAMSEYISHEIIKSKRYKNDLSLISLDIDFFKKINDNYGHQVGDAVLIEISKILTENIRKADILGRWGGEEFMILLPQTNKDNAYIVAENLRKKVEKYKFKNIGTLSISLGVTKFKFDENIIEFINRTDEAMYKAKKYGRNKAVVI